MANFPDFRKRAGRQFGRFRRGGALRDPFPTARESRPDMPRVEILLALFNGERSLGAQLDSIARQSHRAWSLSIRDDGSRDRSIAIARAFAATMRSRDIQVRGGTHRGTARNFLSLLAESDPGADFVACCEADIWNSGGLSHAIDRLSVLPRGVPALQCGPSPETGTVGGPPSFRNALAERISTGSTMVANRAAGRILRAATAYHGPISAHDWWTSQQSRRSRHFSRRKTGPCSATSPNSERFRQ
jgi:glycosyltransferase involved in cell wall biosynthesis